MSQRPSVMRRIAGFGRDYGFRRAMPWCLIGVVVLIIAVYVIQMALPETASRVFVTALGVSPDRLLATGTGEVLPMLWQLGTLISYSFLHDDWLHLAANLASLVIFGTYVCARLHAWSLAGAIVFLCFYVSAAVFAAMAFVLVSIGENVVLIGSSGAVSALMGATSRMIFRRFHPWPDRPAPLSPLTDWRVLGAAIAYLVLNVSVFTPLGRYVFMTDDPGSIAWQVHVAGYAYGLVMITWFDRAIGNGAIGNGAPGNGTPGNGVGGSDSTGGR